MIFLGILCWAYIVVSVIGLIASTNNTLCRFKKTRADMVAKYGSVLVYLWEILQVAVLGWLGFTVGTLTGTIMILTSISSILVTRYANENS